MRKTLLSGCVYLALVAGFTGVVFSADGNPAYTSVKEAGTDYALQGEYVGEVDGNKWGAQVIALGEGKFDVVGFKGGLPGDGWKRGDESKKGSGEVVNGAIEIKGEEAKVKIQDGVFTIYALDGAKLGELKKTERKSPTLGAKPPEGATVLFDGKNADNFENGKLTEGDLLAPSNPISKAKLLDHTMHIEFRTPFMPKSRGQARGNSGVYLQGRYECQVLDSFGLDGADNECGGIYSINKPIVNACLPPLTWQTYDIDFKAARYDAAGKKTENARVTIRQNGIVIHDNQELTHGTPGHVPEAASAYGLYLQDHGNPVAFRNIWFVEKK